MSRREQRSKPPNRPTASGQSSEMLVRPPSAATARAARSLLWWRAPAAAASTRRVYPEPVLPVILDLAGGHWELENAHGRTTPGLANFGAGLHQRFGVLSMPRSPSCVQLQLDPLAAYRFFDVPLHELSERAFDVESVLGPQTAELRERLSACDDAASALTLFDSFVAQRVHGGPKVTPAVAWAWQRIQAKHGAVRVEQLAANIGWSRKHLRQRFLEQVGLSPKAAARLVRFSAVARQLRGGQPTLSLSRLAQEYGYSDQAHMCRDFQHHAGCPPLQYCAQVDDQGVARARVSTSSVSGG